MKNLNQETLLVVAQTKELVNLYRDNEVLYKELRSMDCKDVQTRAGVLELVLRSYLVYDVEHDCLVRLLPGMEDYNEALGTAVYELFRQGMVYIPATQQLQEEHPQEFWVKRRVYGVKAWVDKSTSQEFYSIDDVAEVERDVKLMVLSHFARKQAKKED